MTTSEKKGITTRIFVGVLINSEVRMHLNPSDRWKQDQVIKDEAGEKLDLVSYNSKDYVGIMVKDPSLQLPCLREKEDYVRGALSRYCPNLDVEKFQMYIFPQLFLS